MLAREQHVMPELFLKKNIVWDSTGGQQFLRQRNCSLHLKYLYWKSVDYFKWDQVVLRFVGDVVCVKELANSW